MFNLREADCAAAWTAIRAIDVFFAEPGNEALAMKCVAAMGSDYGLLIGVPVVVANGACLFVRCRRRRKLLVDVVLSRLRGWHSELRHGSVVFDIQTGGVIVVVTTRYMEVSPQRKEKHVVRLQGNTSRKTRPWVASESAIC
jgi:hypothetical protein